MRGLSLGRAIIGYSLVLLVYLPIEPALIGWLPDGPYWVLRLLSDAIIVVLAIAVASTELPPRAAPIRLLWLAGIVTAVLIAANAARGIGPVESINALRVVGRHLALALMLWWALRGQESLGRMVFTAVLVAGAVQIMAAGADVAARLFSGASVFFVDGTLGRYDRLGLFMMSTAIALIATDQVGDRARRAFLIAVIAVLYLTTARAAMIGLGVASLIMLVMPGVARSRRALIGGLAAISLVLVLAIPARLPPPPAADGDGRSGIGDAAQPLPISGDKDAFLSTDPTKNFRLYYNLVLAPWAAVTEPLLGFGPRQQMAEHTDPRLEARTEADGMPWEWARRFMNDSNYASLVVQFGVVVPALFVGLIGWLLVKAMRQAVRRRDDLSRFASAHAAAVLVVAGFGPAFEYRTLSIVFWVALGAAIALGVRDRVD